MKKRKYWTVADLAKLRELYPTMTADALVPLLGYSKKSIYMQAFTLGLRKHPMPFAASVIRRVGQLHAKGLNDVEIGDKLGLNRNQTHHIRYEKLKLPPNEEGIKRAHRKGILTQRKTLGISNAGELRVLSFRNYAVENGWPADFSPREVQILNTLAAHGPMTSRDIAIKIGMSITRKNSVTGCPKLLDGCRRLKPNGREYGTYTASLIARGLICYMHRSRKSGMRGHGRVPGLYMLTLEAINMVKERIQRDELTKAC